MKDWRWTIVCFTTSRLTVFATMLLARMTFRHAEYRHPGGLLSCLTQWDASMWYLEIARRGYWFSLDYPSAVPFFPLYPLLVKASSFVFHDYRVAGVVVSNACFLVALLLFDRLLKIDFPETAVRRAAIAFLTYSPYSFFFSSAYTESTFLLLSVAAVLAARRGYWLLACVAGMLLSATRQVGLLIGLPLAIEYVIAFGSGDNWRERLKHLLTVRVLYLALVPLGLAGYMFYTYRTFGDALAFAHAASSGFRRSFTSPVVTFSTLHIYSWFHDLLFCLAVAAALLCLMLGFWLRLRLSYLAYCALLTATYLCSSTLEALPRYLSVEFPLFIVLALLAQRFRRMYEPLLAASVMALTLCTILFVTGFWIT